MKIYEQPIILSQDYYNDAGKTSHIGIVGFSGSGKTFFADAIITQIKTSVVIFDMGGREETFEKYPEIRDYREFYDLVKAGKPFVVRFTNYVESQVAQAFALCAATTNLTLYLDEANLYANNLTPAPIKDILFRGRKRHQHIIWSAQRPQLVHTDLRSGSSHIIAFQLYDLGSIDKLDASREAGKIIPTLAQHQYIVARGDMRLFA